MGLTTGQRLGPYEIVDAIGKGGMGEVYRARDTSLGRDVALKVLPELFASDAERLARFEREAQALAALNHPNIAQVYAIAEGRAIVMELVDGEDLAQRLARGPLPVDEALPIARQIALALEAAHDAGIIHRDLKPANIKVRPDGTVKVLDFGLAKSFAADPSTSAASLANSPTLTARATELGVVLGTAAYMAPEQAKGRAVDRRADVWAFGVVLYEMLTGRRAFGGDDVTEVMAAVLRDTPDQAVLPADTPAAVRRLLRRCLQKDARKRLRDMGDAGAELDDAMTGAEPDPVTVTTATTPSRSPLAMAGGALLLAGVASAAAWALKPAPVPDQPLARFALLLNDGQRLNNTNNPNLTWSRDGRHLAYRADGAVFVRSLDTLEPREVVRATGSGQWFSPDNSSLVYRTTSGLSTVPFGGGGGGVELVRTAEFGGLDWLDDNTIVYSDHETLKRLPSGGGAATVLLTAPEGTTVGGPRVVPGGRALVYTLVAANNSTTVVAAPLGDNGLGEGKTVLTGVNGATYVRSGHLIYTVDARPMAVPFDAERLEVAGPAVALPESIYVGSTLLPQMAVSDTGTMAYVSAVEAQALQVAWVDRQGRSTTAIKVPRNYSDLMLAPDGRRAAFHLWDEDNDVWIGDLSRGGLTRLTFTDDEEETPVWSPDGRQVAYAAGRPGKRGLFIRAADGSAAAVERKIWEDADHFHVNDWSRDGRTLLVEVRRQATTNDIVAIDVDTGTATVLLGSAYSEYNARLSPDGRWLAYVSDESGQAEVYVQPYPSLDARVAVSTAGGREPVWARNGRALFFRSADEVMEAAVTSLTPLEFGVPLALFRDTFVRTQGAGHTHFDVAADGRFLMIENPKQDNVSRQQIHIVLNWFDQLKRIAPSTR